MADLPDWRPLDGVDPPVTDGSGRVVGVVASEAAATAGWAPEAALQLARSWSADGRRVILVDAALDAPSLHEASGLENREGLSDAVLHGASVARVSHAIDDGAFFVVTAGVPVADSATVVKSGRWHRLAEGMTEAGALLLIYLREGDRGTAAFLGSASDIVVLAGRGDPPPSAVSDLLPLVRAVTGATDRGARSPAGSPRASGPAAVPRPSPAAPVVGGEGGTGRLLLLLIGALLAAAGLGYLLTSVL